MNSLFCIMSETVIQALHFCHPLIILQLIIFSISLMLPKKRYYTFFWWNRAFNSGLWTCKAGALLLQPHLLLTFKWWLGIWEDSLLSALYSCTPLPTEIDIIHCERENENWILFTDCITCALVLQKLPRVFGEKEKVVRNKDPRKKEYWKELSEDTLNPFFPLAYLGLKLGILTC
jgi:hypothetical protein